MIVKLCWEEDEIKSCQTVGDFAARSLPVNRDAVDGHV